MATWNSRGLRGSTLEDLINHTNETYREHKLALIQKIPTPITPVQIDKESRHITLAYFDQKSTVDYIGAVQGIPVCFDAKECAQDTFSLQNIHAHQVAFMESFEEQKGIAFFLLYLLGTFLTGLTLVLIPVYQGLVLWLLCRWTIQWSRVRQGAEQILGGDPSFKIDT